MKRAMISKVEDVNTVGAKLAVGFAIFGLTPAEWAGLATTAYFVAQTAYLIWKWKRESKDVDKK